jgi:TRAP-type mannitol/chloroaromatic compound transport system permease small subunit
MWPIKVIMCVGIVLMLLQAFAMLFRDILRISGRGMSG